MSMPTLCRPLETGCIKAIIAFKHDKTDNELRCHDAVQQLQSRMSCISTADSQRVIPYSASTTKGIISKKNYHCSVSFYLSMNLAEHTAANLALFESGALYLITFSRHIVRLAENLKNDTVILFPRCSQNSGGFRQFSMTVTPTY